MNEELKNVWNGSWREGQTMNIQKTQEWKRLLFYKPKPHNKTFSAKNKGLL